MDLISRQAAIDAVAHITSTMSVCLNKYECNGMKRMQNQAVIELAELPSAQPYVPDINVGDMISRQAAIDAIEILLEQSEDDEHDKTWNNAIRSSINAVKHHLPSAQPEPIWGLPVSADRPLADVEIVPRLREIQKQIPGGSYAIDRAIEIIEAVAERRTDDLQ